MLVIIMKMIVGMMITMMMITVKKIKVMILLKVIPIIMMIIIYGAEGVLKIDHSGAKNAQAQTMAKKMS